MTDVARVGRAWATAVTVSVCSMLGCGSTESATQAPAPGTLEYWEQQLRGLTYQEIVPWTEVSSDAAKESEPLPEFASPWRTGWDRQAISGLEFSQASAAGTFPDGGRVWDVARELQTDAALASVVGWQDESEQVWAHDSQALVAAIMSGTADCVNVLWATRSHVLGQRRKFTTHTDGNTLHLELDSNWAAVIAIPDGARVDCQKDSAPPPVFSERCGPPRPPQTAFTIHEDPGTPYVDYNRPFKNAGTDLVNEQFFDSKSHIYHFFGTVYTGLEQALMAHQAAHPGEVKGADALTLVFKGGNVLRLVYNAFLAQLPKEVGEVFVPLAASFKRSDFDFSIYADPRKLNDYDTSFASLTSAAFMELDRLRDELLEGSEKYFGFVDASESDAVPVFKELVDGPALQSLTTDEGNFTWYGVTPTGMALPWAAYNEPQDCGYEGQFDYLFEPSSAGVHAVRASDAQEWIYNSDNRTLEWPWPADPEKTTRFNLVRAKVAFNYFSRYLGVGRDVIGGELIDVSLPHRDDTTFQHFMETFHKNVAEYRLKGEASEPGVTFKTYTNAYLAYDLERMLFRDKVVPWDDLKYEKRLRRLAFFYALNLFTDVSDNFTRKEILQTAIADLECFRSQFSSFTGCTEPNQDGGLLIAQLWVELDALMGRLTQEDDADFHAFVDALKKDLHTGLDAVLAMQQHLDQNGEASAAVQIPETFSIDWLF